MEIIHNAYTTVNEKEIISFIGDNDDPIDTDGYIKDEIASGKIYEYKNESTKHAEETVCCLPMDLFSPSVVIEPWYHATFFRMSKYCVKSILRHGILHTIFFILVK